MSDRRFYQKPGATNRAFFFNYLNGPGANTVITGGIGEGAIDIFNEKILRWFPARPATPSANVLSEIEHQIIHETYSLALR